MTLSFLGTGFPHLESKSVLAALDRLLVADSQTNMWNHKQITFAQFQAIVASNVESVNGLTGIVSLGLGDLDDIPDPTTGSTFLSWNGSAFVWAGGGVGETNLMANVGSGADIWKDKTSVTFNVRGILGIEGISAVVNADNIDINFDVASLTSGQKTSLVTAIQAELATATDLTDLGDVVITTPSDGQFLKWNGTNWVNADLPSSSGGFNISTLSLVTTSAAPANDMVAIYSASLAAHKKISITNLLAIAGFTGDTYFKVSATDTTAGYGATKITATNGLARTIVDPSGAESMSFELDYATLSAAVTPTPASSYIAILDHTSAYKKIAITDFLALNTIHLLKTGGALTGALLQAQSTDIASATTTDLSTMTGDTGTITGTTTITGFGTVQAGTLKYLTFADALILTHHATNLKLKNSGSNITTAAGDTMIIKSLGAGAWEVMSYERASGFAVNAPDTSRYGNRDKQYTAGEDIADDSIVYVSAANTVKRMKPDTYNSTGSSISSAPDHLAGIKLFPLSTNGYYIHFTGGFLGTAGVLYAQVRYSTDEATFSNGGEQTIYATGSGCNVYDVCQIDTDKFLVIFQTNTAGSGVGIKCVVISVSGSTITMGSIVTIESTGQINCAPSCAKVDTNKGIIFYRADSNSDIYGQVLTVSGVTITTNTPYLVYTLSSTFYSVACQLDTNTVLMVHDDGSSSGVLGNVISVSGIVITVGADQSIGGGFGASGHRFGLTYVSSTKALLFSNDDNGSSSPSTDSVRCLAISGNTVTCPGSLYEINGSGTGRTTRYWPCVVMGTSRAFIATNASATSARLNLLDISGVTPTSLQTSTHAISSTTNPPAMCKVFPWVMVAVLGTAGADDYLFRLTPGSSARIGMAETAFLSGATEYITLRFQIANSSGLTAGSIYYVDDTGLLTTKSSTIAPVAGIADSTTTILLT